MTFREQGHPSEQGQVLTAVPFETFRKIPRLFREVVVTEKIDGTNAQIYIPHDEGSPMLVGSRNRWITPGKTTDNYGFAAWAYANEAALRRLGPGRHFGEWYGVGIARNYGLAERRWALFTQKELPEGLPANVGKVPVLATLPTPDTGRIEQVTIRLRQDGSVAVPGFMNPEGIVVFHKASGQLFKYTLDGDALPKARPSPEEGIAA